MLKTRIVNIENSEELEKEEINAKKCMDKLAILQTDFISRVVLLADCCGYDRDQLTWIAGNALLNMVTCCDFDEYEVPVEQFDRFYAEIEALK